MPTQPRKRTLGRGLTTLLSQPVSVELEAKQPSQPPSPGAPADGLMMAPTDAITPSPYQPRQVISEEAIESLALSLKSSGLIQPILIRPAPGRMDHWELIAGERRWRAAKRVGLASIPAIVKPLSDQEAAEAALVENEQRKDLNPIERGFAYRTLCEQFGLSQTEVGERVGVDRSTVANLIRLSDLEPEIRDLISRGKLTAGHGKALLAAPAGAGRLKLARRAAEQDMSVRTLESAASKLASGEAESPSQPRESADRPPHLATIEKQLSDHLGARVSVSQLRKGGGAVTIRFKDVDHFQAIAARMRFALES